MRILIAEDELLSRTVLATVLRKAGHEVTITSNGAEAYEVLRKPDAPALAILDWMMPEMDGLEVVCRIRSEVTNRPPYIMMLTVKGNKDDIVAVLNAGANDYLTKPFDPGELRARVAVGLRMIEMQDALIKSRETLSHQASHDPLTGLLNRGAVLDRLREELERTRRHGDSLAIGICDIDHFKQINDTYGHQTGDDVLSELTQVLSKSLRLYDTVGRVGGEEFLIITPMKAGTDWLSVFERLCAEVAASKLTTRSSVLSVTISIGAARAAGEDTVDKLLAAADAALYRAKNEGRSRVANAG